MPMKPPVFRPSYLPAPKEQAKAYDRERGSQRERGYTRQWEKARRAFLAQHPLCVMCKAEGRATSATDLDHKIPHRSDQALFWDAANWQPLCHAHHSRKTRAERGRVFGG
jgi:5-methylcytosine-specific restriction enzyme A